MLETRQLSDLDAAANDLNDKKLLLDTMVDVQVVLQILVEKGVITREEVEQKREVVRNARKYKDAYAYIQQTAEEIQMYKNNPQELLKEIMRRKMEGR